MSEDKKDSFWAKNFTLINIIGMILGLLFSLLYWWKKGQFSDSIIKNNIFVISLWGILMGYVTFDLIKSGLKKTNKKEN